MALTTNQLTKLFPRAAPGHVEQFVARCGQVFTAYAIDANPNRVWFFLAQVAHESGGLRVLEENLTYTNASRLCRVWPSRFPTLASAQSCVRNPEKLANKVYAGRMGNNKPGDGYRFRGRGYIQLTGRDAYATVGGIVGLPLLERPELATAPDSALLVACGFWKWKRLNALCDTGDFEQVTKRINGGTTGLQDRYKLLELVQRTVPNPTKGGTSATRGPSGRGPDHPRSTGTAGSLDHSLPWRDIARVQAILRELGYYRGSVDGIVGTELSNAVTDFRLEHGLPVTAALDHETVTAIAALDPR